MDPLSELNDLLSKSKDRLTDVLFRLVRAKAERRDPTPAFGQLHRLLTQTLSWSHLMGRRRVRLDVAELAPLHPEARAVAVKDRPAGDPGTQATPPREQNPTVPAVTFEDAVDDILARHPVLAAGYKATSEAMNSGHAFSLAKSTEEVVTKRVQEIVAEGIASGRGQYSTAKVISEMTGWTESYSALVYRTNATTAYAAGRMAEARDPDIAEVMPAVEYVGRKVPPSRQNHINAVGLIAATNDPIWDLFTPPSGYNCQHGLRLVSKFELKRRGLLNEDGSVITYKPPNFANAYPDPGFNVGSLRGRLGI